MKKRNNFFKSTYVSYADIYDEFKGDRTENIGRLKGLIEKYNPDATKVLDLACGTGAIAQGLVGRYSVVGIDNSASMLKIAKAKLPHIQFIHADMTDFKLDQKFDVIYCLHNSVNHLLSLEKWLKLFENVATHLTKSGIFIFDINPIEKMDFMVKWGLGIKPVNQNYIATQVHQDSKKREHYKWDVKIFLKQRRDKFILKHETIKVCTYPLWQVEELLTRTFTIKDSFVLKNIDNADDDGRAYYICCLR